MKIDKQNDNASNWTYVNNLPQGIGEFNTTNDHPLVIRYYKWDKLIGLEKIIEKKTIWVYNVDFHL